MGLFWKEKTPSYIRGNTVDGRLRPEFPSKLVHRLAFETAKFNIVAYDKINHRFVKLRYNCDVKSGLKVHEMEEDSMVVKLDGRLIVQWME